MSSDTVLQSHGGNVILPLEAFHQEFKDREQLVIRTGQMSPQGIPSQVYSTTSDSDTSSGVQSDEQTSQPVDQETVASSNRKRSYSDYLEQSINDAVIEAAYKEKRRLANKYDSRMRQLQDHVQRETHKFDELYQAMSNQLQDFLDDTMERLGKESADLSLICPKWYCGRRE